MSAGVSDQRMKGQGNQVPNGSKEQIGPSEGAASTAEEFEPWRAQQQNSVAHTAYGTTVPISSATDIYNMNSAGYYGSGGTYPYQTYGVGDGTWSNGTDMTFLGGYAAHDSYSVDGMFGPSTQFSTATYQGQPSSFNYFPSNGDYGNWGNQLSGPRKYDEYYRDPQQNLYSQAVPDNSLKSVEHAMQNLELKPSSDTKDQQKKATWASIASQPAKPQINVPSQGLKKKGPGMPPGPIVPGKHNIDIGTWETNKSLPPQVPMPIINNPPPPLLQQPPPKQQQQQQQQSTLPPSAITGPGRPNWPGPPPQGSTASRQPPHHLNQQPPHRGHQQQQQQPSMAPVSASFQQPPMMTTHLPPPIPQPGSHHNIQGMILPPNQVPFEPSSTQIQNTIISNHPVLEKLKGKNNYNPPEFDLSAPSARFFVIKSYSEDDIHRSIKYEIWCSTEHGNKRLDQAFREREGNGCLYLFFSVNGSGHFCGMAQMISAVDYHSNSSVWSQDKWKGQFKVRWIYVKDVPNVQLRHIQLENNDNKPVTNSRDAQEVPHARGLQVLRIMHSYRHSTSIFDDFIHYEKRQEEEDHRKVPKEMMGHHSHPHSHQQPHHHQSGGENRGGRGGGGGGGGGADHHQQQQQQHRGGEIVRHHERDAERNEGYHPHRGGGGGGGGHRGGEREERHHHLSGGAGTGGHNNNNRDRDNNRGRGGGGRNNGPRN